jgi:hypothetical protein
LKPRTYDVHPDTFAFALIDAGRLVRTWHDSDGLRCGIWQDPSGNGRAFGATLLPGGALATTIYRTSPVPNPERGSSHVAMDASARRAFRRETRLQAAREERTVFNEYTVALEREVNCTWDREAQRWTGCDSRGRCRC